jgi:DNA polymerase I-like protein with 3'-5' exonuclease and polymerase domains
MLNRPLHPKQKTVTLIVDVPNKIELENEEPFSSASNLNLLTSLRTGRVNIWNKEPISNFTGINSLDIFTTYLDYDYYGEAEVQLNFDFNKECKKRKELDSEDGRFFSEDIEYFLIPHQKDLYVSRRLWNHIQSLIEEIKKVGSKLIIVTGKWALFFLTGSTTFAQTAGTPKDKKPLGGLVKFRSSVMEIHPCWGEFDAILVPIYHTVNSSGMPDKVPIMEIDIQKLAYRYHKIKEEGIKYFLEPPKEYILGTEKDVVLSYLSQIKETLDEKPTLLCVDIETFFHSVIDCVGITLSKDSGICIPFCTVDKPYFWNKEDEIDILCAIREVLLHPNALHLGQNYQYDCQYFYFCLKMKINGEDDTMVLHHILYNYLPKDLAFLASVYCEFYRYWKDDIAASAENPETRWIYNIKDIQYTLEIHEVLSGMLRNIGGKLEELYYFQQRRLSPVLVNMMERGVRIDVEEKERLYNFFKNLMNEIELKINDVLGFEFNQNSTPQKKSLFKDYFGMTLKVKKKGGNETCDSSAMLAYIQEYPKLRPFLTLLLEYASLKVFVNNFLAMKLDDDGRARTQYGLAATATGRLNSRKNVRGRGGNLMNIPEKGKINLKYAVEVLDYDEAETSEEDYFDDFVVEGSISLPNIKEIFLPDEGKEIMDADLSGADIQIVAWDSQCKWLMDYFSNPKNTEKVYRYIANNFFQREISNDEYKTFKGIFHGTNYLMGIAKLAAMARIPEWQARELQEYYFHLNPEIPLWHQRIERSIKKQGYIENIFGRRAWFLNKNDVNLMNKAAAFIPQSSIADVMNRALVTIEETLPEVEILLQVHDSGVFQYDIEIADEMRKKIKTAMEVVIPYKPELIIPSDFKVSRKSYGSTEKVK